MKILSTFFLFLIICFSANAQQRTQMVRGTVTNSGVGSPMPGATIKITGTTPVKGAVTDQHGYFKIKDVPVGRHTVVVSSVGYKTTTINNVVVISGKEIVLDIKLDEKPVMGKKVKITANKDQHKANNTLITSSVINLRPEAINRFAGTRSDPAKMAASFAGVAGDNSMRNDMIVRGNSPLGMLWRVDGIDVPNPNHFTVAGSGGGIFSILNNNLLSNCDFMTGAFPAEYGNSIGGAFDIHLRNGNNEKREHTFQISMNGLELGTEGPIVEGSRASYLANIRFVSLRPVTALGVDLNVNAVPEYLDGTIKIDVPTENAGRFTLWGMGGYSNAEVKDSEDDDIDWEDEIFVEDSFLRSKMYAAGFTHTYLFGEKTVGKLTIGTSASIINTSEENVWENDSTWNMEDFDAIEGRHQFKYSLSHKLTPKLLTKIGISYSHLYFEDKFVDFDEDDEVYNTKMHEEGSAGLSESYIHFNYKFTSALTANAGLHYQYFDYNGSYAIEPRLSVNYDITPTFSINAAYGLHSQAHPLLYYFYRYPEGDEWIARNKDLDFTRSNHYVLGFNKVFSEDFFVKADFFYQHQYDVPVSTSRKNINYYSFANLGGEFAFDPEDSTFNKGFARNYGVELTVNKSFSEGYYFMVTGTLFRSLYTNGAGKESGSAFDLGHVLNMLGGVEYKLDDFNKYVLSVDTKVAWIGGRRYIPCDYEKSIRHGKYKPDWDRGYADKWDDYFSWDIKIGLNINLENTTHNIFIAVDNMINHKNVADMDWDNSEQEIEYDYQLGLFPYLGYRINF